MPIGRADSELQRCLEEIREHHGDSIKAQDVVEVVKTVMDTLEGNLEQGDEAIYDELEELAKFIVSAKSEIEAIRPEQVKEEFLPAAADELDAVVAATADAANAIMDATEIIESVMGSVDAETSNKLMDAVTQIYEACGFQDITGQRINKVIGTLKHIEEKIDGLLATFGPEEAREQAAADRAVKTKQLEEERLRQEEQILHGPALPETSGSSTQDDIDALLASFD